jgi:hypothetical protein
VPVLEDELEDAVARAHGQQVEHYRLDRDHDRPERDEQEQERQPEHEREYVRQVGLHGVVEVLRTGGHAGHVRLDAVDVADGGRDDVVAQGGERRLRDVVGAVAVERDRDRGDRLVRGHGGRHRVGHLAAGQGLLGHVLDAGLDLRLRHVVGLDGHDGRQRAAGERGLDAVVDLRHLEVLRQARGAGVDGLHAERRDAEAEQERAGDHERDDRAAQDAVEHPVPHARLAVVAMSHAPDDRDPALLDLVAKLGKHGGEHRQGAEHRHGDHEDRADREALEDDAAGEEHAGHGDHHCQAGDEHRVARGGRRELERVLTGAPGVALLHLAPEVEHRVVDADGEADEQDHRAGRLVHRDDLADRRQQAEGCRHGGEAEQEGHAGGNERAEGDDEDQEGDGEGEDLGLLEVVLEGLRDGLLGARVAELADEDVGVGALGRGGGVERRRGEVADLVLVTGDLERDEAGAAVLGELALVAGDERRLDFVDVRGRLEARDHVRDRGLERWIADLDGALALDEDLLLGGVAEVGIGDRVISDLRLTVAVVLLGDRLLADGTADHERDDDERQPAEDRRLAVAGAPAAGTRSEVLGLH